MLFSESYFEIRRYRDEVEAHAHPHHQVVLPIQGTLHMDIGGRADNVATSKAALITAGQRHSFVGSPGNSFLVLDIPRKEQNGREIRQPLWGTAVSRPFVAIDRPLNRLCEFLAGEVDRYGSHGVDQASAGDMLVGALERRVGIHKPPCENSLARAVHFIKAHCREEITVEDAAGVAGLSVSRFHLLFRERFATTPGRYITERRLEHAIRLLEHTERPIADVALCVGYADQSAFTRAFRRIYETSPEKYRQNAQQKEIRHNI